MSKIRFIVFISALSIPVLVFAISYSIIGVFASNSDSLPQRAAVQDADEAGLKIYQQSERAVYGRVPARIIEEGMAIYHESERNLGTFQSANETGLKIYQQSEWADYRGVPFRVIQEGMAIYHESERTTSAVGPTFSNEEGLAIYHESERSSNPVQLVGSKQAGMAIYHASERNTIKPAERLYDGKPFNAYQRSEWLGAER